MARVSSLIVSADLYAELLAHVRGCRPKEAVGLLGGSATGQVKAVLPLMNIAAGNKAFIADPYAQFRALRWLRSENLDLLAIYHSHPDGGVEPSPEDLVYARRWHCIHVIVAFSMQTGLDERCRAFRCDRLGAIEEIQIRSVS